MKAVHCPCGEVIEAETDDELVEQVQQHVREDHPELASEYTREKILSIADEHQLLDALTRSRVRPTACTRTFAPV